MKMQLIRNATLRFNYAGHTFIIDPYLAAKHTLPSYTGKSPNPLVDLPISQHEAIAGIEMAIVSHLHTDHFDQQAQERLPKDTTILCQPENEARIKEIGFLEVNPVATSVRWNSLAIHRTSGRHGSSEAVLRAMGAVSGFVFAAENEPTVYWAGDTIWYEAIKENIDQWQPDIIITHSGGAVWAENELIIMDAEQTAELCEYAPEAIVVATHLEALDHCLTTRAALRKYAREHRIKDEQLRIPEDGEELEF